MKRWQVEQIFYLNESGKRKLAVPDPQHLTLHDMLGDQTKKENFAVVSLRRLCNFFLNVL